MNRLMKLLILFICMYSVFGCDIISQSIGREESIMYKYKPWQWKDAGARATYDTDKNEIVIEKTISTPAWGGSILEIGKIDLDKDYYLKFKVVDVYGLYSIVIHYGGSSNYEHNYIKIQHDTTIMGNQEYNISEALRLQGLKGKQEVALKIYVIDPYEEKGTAWLRLKRLRLAIK
ncbi:MAG: hypothetical protein ABH954_05555 [Candidatus Omnitrophota bacterium]